MSKSSRLASTKVNLPSEGLSCRTVLSGTVPGLPFAMSMSQWIASKSPISPLSSACLAALAQTVVDLCEHLVHHASGIGSIGYRPGVLNRARKRFVQVNMLARPGTQPGNSPASLDVGANAHDVDFVTCENFFELQVRHTQLARRQAVQTLPVLWKSRLIRNCDQLTAGVGDERSDIALKVSPIPADSDNSKLSHLVRPAF